jgi:hypothetical protein
MRCIEEVDLLAGLRIEKWREEGRCAVWHGERKVLDMVSYSSQCFQARGAGEGAWGEGQAGSLEKRCRCEVTTF